MNLKLKAAAISLGVIGSGFLTGFVMSQLPYWVSGIFVLVFALVLVYNLALASLKFDETVDEMREKYKD